MRHADAEERSASGRDEDRALTRDGAERSAAVGRGLARLAPRVEVVLSSPFRRARETADAVAKALAVEVRAVGGLEPGHTPAEVLRALSAGKWRAALLVGHQPLLGEVAGLMVHGDERRDLPLRKAAVARVSWDPEDGGTLEALLPADVLERLG